MFNLDKGEFLLKLYSPPFLSSFGFGAAEISTYILFSLFFQKTFNLAGRRKSPVYTICLGALVL